MEQEIETITLHDPQYQIDRDQFFNIPDSAIEFGRPVEDLEDARKGISRYASMFPGKFRVERLTG
jgi:imidazoleglycerol phosphate dehydratase HisB